ncbi:NF-kappa-B inhibitor-interacting Ras-like protein 1 isoform X1 [Gracilinanus agilis]|uniref:NF-kappa-B inhibitor-interacting Ras-like protein 1 isoform X1 n=1 Tax=Gracilinanus agilis TaxID=191870 RepID=UPI001CFD8E7F|nr:NF-kappa-B inhibitor-interacting Ras-like protein 1 isoform X1 [Gracilinanus agilis]
MQRVLIKFDPARPPSLNPLPPQSEGPSSFPFPFPSWGYPAGLESRAPPPGSERALSLVEPLPEDLGWSLPPSIQWDDHNLRLAGLLGESHEGVFAKRFLEDLPQETTTDKMGKGFKVVVCGAVSVGKTAILEQLLYGNHVIGLEDNHTMEDVYVASVETDRGVKEQLRLYDTRGVQEGMDLPRHYMAFADGFVMVYSVTDMESFRRVEIIKKEIDKVKDKKEVTIVILGNKSDLSEQRQVDADMAQYWAKVEKVRLWEVTVTDRKTLMEPFIFLASKLTQPPSKSFPLPGRKKGNILPEN